MAWGKLGTDTLTSAGSTLTVTGFTGKKNIFMIAEGLGVTAGDETMQFNNDTGSNYSLRSSEDGTADGTLLNRVEYTFQRNGNGSQNDFFFAYIVNVSSEEKLIISFSNQNITAGAGTAPNRHEIVGKWANTSNEITEIDVNSNSANFQTDSNLSVFASDLTPAAAITFPTNVQLGSRAEITDTRKMYSYEITPTYEDDFSSYADQTAADAAWVSNDTADFRVNITNDNFAFDSKVTSTTNTGAYYDLGTALSDTAWVVDFKMVISTLTLYSSGSVGAATYITMNNSGTGGAIGGTVDAIGFYMSSTASGGRFEMTKADGSALNIGGGTLTTINATGTYYVRIIRLSSTSMRLELYSDPGRSQLIEGKTRTDVASTTTGLQYFRIQDNQSSAGTGTGQQIGTIDDIKIYDGVTSPSSSTNYAWQEIGA